MNKSTQGSADAASNGIVEQAKQTVANVASEAKEGVTTQLEQKIDQAKEKGVETAETVSEALRGAGEKLEGTGPLPNLANKAAEGIENLANYFETKTVGDLFRSIEHFGRRQPGLFLGGALAVGILAGRFMKSSASRGSNMDIGRGGSGDVDRYETFGYEEEYGSEGDYLSADDLEDEWDTGVGGVGGSDEEPLAFQSDAEGIGITGSGSRGNTEKMPVTQGTKPDDVSNINKSNR